MLFAVAVAVAVAVMMIVGVVVTDLAVALRGYGDGDGVGRRHDCVVVILIFASGDRLWGLFAVEPVASITGPRAKEGQ